MSDWISSSVKDAFEKMMARFQYYPADKFAKAACPHSSQLRYPRAPGDKSYLGGEVTAFRHTGEDPGFQRAKGEDVPQDLIHAFREGFTDALDLFMPEHSVRSFALEKLQKRAFSNIHRGEEGIKRERKDALLNHLPRITETAPEKADFSLRISFEFDVRRQVKPEANMLDIRHDRKNLTNYDLLRTYRYVTHSPELWVAINLWQNLIEQYTDQILDLGLQHLRKLKTDEKYLNVIADEHFPVFHTISFTNNSLNMLNFPLFFTASILAKSGHNLSGQAALPNFTTINAGIIAAQQAGIFRRKFDTPDGERKVICPFGFKATKLLKLDLGETQSVEETLLAFCLKKVIEERYSNLVVKDHCDAASEAALKMLETTDQGLIARMDQQYARAKAPCLEASIA